MIILCCLNLLDPEIEIKGYLIESQQKNKPDVTGNFKCYVSECVEEKK